MDQTTPLPLSAYGNMPSAANKSNHFMFNFDQTAIKNMNAVGPTTAGKTQLPPFSATGNDKFEWGPDLNGGALHSPNIFQQKGFPYTPIMTTGAAYSLQAKGQNYFNFANTQSIDEQNTMQQMHNAANSTNQNGAAFAATPQQIQYFNGENLNSIYGNPAFNGNNIQAAVTANGLLQTQQQNYAATPATQNTAINPLGGQKLNEEAATPFQMENTFQFGNFNQQTQNSNGKNPPTQIIGVAGNNKPGQNGVVQQSQFVPQQQQFPQQASQQGQSAQQATQQQQANPQQQQQQQFQNMQKNQFFNGAFNYGNQQGEQNFQDMNQLQAAAANGATNQQQQQQLAAAVAAAGNPAEKKKPQLQLSLQIPTGNSMNNNNQNGPQTNANNLNTANPQTNQNGPLNTTEGNGFYFYSNNNIGLAPFTPIGTTTMGYPPLNGAPPSSHLPPFRTGQQQYDNFFFNAQQNMQNMAQIPDQYPLLTPGGNTGYNKQQFFYPAPGSDQAGGPAQFMQQQYQAQTPNAHHPNNPQLMQQHQHQFQQQQQQGQQQSQFQQHQQQSSQSQQQQLMHQQGQGFGMDSLAQQSQQMTASTEKNDQKKKTLNLKLDVSMKDTNFGIVPSFEKGSSGDQKKGMLGLGSGLIDSASKAGVTNGTDDDKDKNILSMLQKNNPQNNLNPSSYLDAANMSLIIDFYQKANPEKKQQLYDFLSNQQNDDKDDNQKNKSQKIIEYIITANTKRIGTLTLQQRMEKIQKYREKRMRRPQISLVKYKKQQIAVSKKPRDKNGKFLKQLDEETISKKKIKKK